MSYEDRYGQPLTTSSRAAVDAYIEGADRLLSVQPGAETYVRRAIDADPSFALAHILKRRQCSRAILKPAQESTAKEIFSWG